MTFKTCFRLLSLPCCFSFALTLSAQSNIPDTQQIQEALKQNGTGNNPQGISPEQLRQMMETLNNYSEKMKERNKALEELAK